MIQLVSAVSVSLLVVAALYTAVGIKWGFKWHQIYSRSFPLGLCIGIGLWLLSPELVTQHIAWFLIGVVGLTAVGVPGTILPFFFRDPERTIPADSNLLVAPADGEVLYIKRIEAGEIPVGEKRGRRHTLEEWSKLSAKRRKPGFLVGIAMDFLDVHVNRAPIDGKVTFLQHIPGTFRSLRNPEAVLTNERQTIAIENELTEVVIVQIASRLVRRIEAFVAQGDIVEKGQRVGIIKFGSQVDIYVAEEDVTEILVTVGDQVYAGESPLLRLLPGAEGSSAVRIPDQRPVQNPT